MILVSKYIVPKGYVGITIFPFVFLKYKALKKDAVLLNHEKIHLKQQLELLVIPFYLLYLIEFFVRLVQYNNMYAAYKNISFEREAYVNERDFNYLKKKQFFSFMRYYKE